MSVASFWTPQPVPVIVANLSTSVRRSKVTTPGATTNGIFSVTFSNVGTTNATVNGVELLPGENVSLSGYFDDFSRKMNRLASIAYVASATAILHITEQD